MKKWIFLLLCCLSVQSFSAANSGHIDGEGRFYSLEDDSLAFVKRVLLYNAFKDVIGKELKNIGLDDALFWQKYDERFDEYFLPIADKLKADYGIKDGEDVPAKKRDEFEKALREKKLSLKSRFGRINQVVSSYSIKKMSRATQSAQSRYMNISAKVDRQELSDLYFSYTRSDDFKSYKNVFITVDYKLEDMSWLDLGVEVERDFTSVISEHWRNILTTQLGGVATNIVISDSSMREKLDNYLKIPSEATIAFNKDKRSIQENSTMGILNMDDELKQSLWLKVRVGIKKLGDSALTKKRSFSFDGDFIMQDLTTKKIVSFYDFIPEKASFSFENAHELSSNSASLVYRLPMNEFKDLKKKLSALGGNRKKIKLELKGFRSIAEVDNFSKYLETKGVTLGVETKLISLGKESSILQVEFRGENDPMVSLLKALNKADLNDSRTMMLEDEMNPFTIVLGDGGAKGAKVRTN